MGISFLLRDRIYLYRGRRRSLPTPRFCNFTHPTNNDEACLPLRWAPPLMSREDAGWWKVESRAAYSHPRNPPRMNRKRARQTATLFIFYCGRIRSKVLIWTCLIYPYIPFCCGLSNFVLKSRALHEKVGRWKKAEPQTEKTFAGRGYSDTA
jgi:hypothetical protein